MEEETRLVHVIRQATLTVVNKSGSLYLKLPYDQNKAWGMMAGDVVTLGIIAMERPKK